MIARRTTAKPQQRKRPSVFVKVTIYSGVVAIIAIAFLVFSKSNSTEPAKLSNKKQTPIQKAPPFRSAKPSHPTSNPPQLIKEAEPPPYWKRDTTNGLSAAQIRKWKAAHRAPPGYTNDTSRTEAPPQFAIFNHASENEIACLLTIEPGMTLVGEPSYGKHFLEDFMKSCETPIVVTEDDTPEQAELKRLMNETKIDLRQRMADGEDLGQILRDTRQEYVRLAEYKQTLEHELNELKKDNSLSMEDIDDFVKAANKLLDAQGIAPIKMSPITRRMLMRRRGL